MLVNASATVTRWVILYIDYGMTVIETKAGTCFQKRVVRWARGVSCVASGLSHANDRTLCMFRVTTYNMDGCRDDRMRLRGLIGGVVGRCAHGPHCATSLGDCMCGLIGYPRYV